jgi:hypothetical protein
VIKVLLVHREYKENKAHNEYKGYREYKQILFHKDLQDFLDYLLKQLIVYL